MSLNNSSFFSPSFLFWCLLVVNSFFLLASAHANLQGILGKGTLAGLDGQPLYPVQNPYMSEGEQEYNAADCRDCTNPPSQVYDQYMNFVGFGNDTKHGLYGIGDYWRYKDTGFLQCSGRAKSTPNITVTEGETIELAWAFAVNHPGPGAVYISFDNDDTWTLLTQTIDVFMSYWPDNPDIFNNGGGKGGYSLLQKIALPLNMPSSSTATLRGEFFNVQGQEMYTSCIDITTIGSGPPITDGFKIVGTDNGPSHLPNLLGSDFVGIPYPAYQAPWDFVKNGIGWDNYLNNVWPAIGGPKAYDFGARSGLSPQYATNLQVIVNSTRDDPGQNYPAHLYASTMNVPGATAVAISSSATALATSSSATALATSSSDTTPVTSSSDTTPVTIAGTATQSLGAWTDATSSAVLSSDAAQVNVAVTSAQSSDVSSSATAPITFANTAAQSSVPQASTLVTLPQIQSSPVGAATVTNVAGYRHRQFSRPSNSHHKPYPGTRW